jgi:hypothetical protein
MTSPFIYLHDLAVVLSVFFDSMQRRDAGPLDVSGFYMRFLMIQNNTILKACLVMLIFVLETTAWVSGKAPGRGSLMAMIALTVGCRYDPVPKKWRSRYYP